MKDRLGSIGWKEFHQNRENILNEYDRIRKITHNRPVQVAHGNAVEAYIRTWLSEFLPKKYGVSSGYIIPEMYQQNYTLYHFDIIIYNRLDSPVLWIEGNNDQSEQGKSLAIPAKYIAAIYEVKSTLNPKTAKASIEKMMSINLFKEYLPKGFSSGVIFVELLENQIRNQKILPNLFNGVNVPGFWGGAVLRCDIDDTMTGLLTFVNSDSERTPQKEENKNPVLAKPIDDLNIFLDPTGKLTIAENGGGVAMVATGSRNWSVIKQYGVNHIVGKTLLYLNWSRSKFSEFAIQIVSALEGLPYNDKKRPIFGQVFDNVEFKNVTEQAKKPEKGQAFFKIHPEKFENSNAYIEYTIDNDKLKVRCQYQVTNIGDRVATATPDRFNTSITIFPNESRKFVREVEISEELNKLAPKEIVENLKKDILGFNIPLELIYKTDDNKHFIKTVQFEFKWNSVKKIL